MTTSDVENYPGRVESVGGYDLIEAMGKQSQIFGTKIVSGHIFLEFTTKTYDSYYE